MHTTTCHIAFALLTAAAFAPTAGAVTLNLPLSASAQADSPDESDFPNRYAANPIVVAYTPDDPLVKERRGVFEFSLASLPAGAVVEYAELLFDVTDVTTRQIGENTSVPSVRFFGYAGNNAIDESDPTSTSTILSFGTFINEAGPWAVPLNTNGIQFFIDNDAAAVGLVAYANSTDLPLSIASAAGGSFAAPVLSLTLSGAPLPGDFNGDGTLDASDLAIIHNGFANQLTGYENGDFDRNGVISREDLALFDRELAHFAPSATPAALVPEPAATALLLPMTTLLYRRRRTAQG